MPITRFVQLAAGGRCRITLDDGQVATGRFRTDILSRSALSAYFYGDVRDMSLPIASVIDIEILEQAAVAS